MHPAYKHAKRSVLLICRAVFRAFIGWALVVYGGWILYSIFNIDPFKIRILIGLTILFYVALHGLKVYKLAKKEIFSKQEIRYHLLKRGFYIFSILLLIYGGLIHHFNSKIESRINITGKCESLQREFQERLLTVQICGENDYWGDGLYHPIRINVLDQKNKLLARRYYVYKQIAYEYEPVDYSEKGLSYFCLDGNNERHLSLPPSILDGLLTHIPFSDPGQFDLLWDIKLSMLISGNPKLRAR
jgi:hypothetical protein